ncbi:MAG TPA: hypothetical protein DIS59_00110, partial [Candidatus Magasanikbacteria bacterium]|nr:hypothetical protein [Candidatus Magasanikbacteria bacterium]
MYVNFLCSCVGERTPSSTVSREDHLRFCKERAIELAEAGKLDDAVMSFMSDMGKHPKTAEHPALELLFIRNAMGHLKIKGELIEFING